IITRRDDIEAGTPDGGIGDVGVGGIDGNLSYAMAVENAPWPGRERPSRTTVIRHQNAAPENRVAGVVGHAGAGVDFETVGGRDGDRAHREGGLVVG